MENCANKLRFRLPCKAALRSNLIKSLISDDVAVYTNLSVVERLVGQAMKSNVSHMGHPAVDAVKNFYILRAAQNVNRFEPFSEPETELNNYLTDRMAGKRLCDYAWRMFAQSL